MVLRHAVENHSNLSSYIKNDKKQILSIEIQDIPLVHELGNNWVIKMASTTTESNALGYLAIFAWCFIINN